MDQTACKFVAILRKYHKIRNCSFLFFTILDFTESQDYEIVYEECETLRFSKMYYYDTLFLKTKLNVSSGNTTVSHAGVFQ